MKATAVSQQQPAKHQMRRIRKHCTRARMLARTLARTHTVAANMRQITAANPPQPQPATASASAICYLLDRVHSDKVSKSRRESVNKNNITKKNCARHSYSLTAGRRCWARNGRALTHTFCFDMRTRAATASTYQT